MGKPRIGSIKLIKIGSHFDQLAAYDQAMVGEAQGASRPKTQVRPIFTSGSKERV